ncbi:alpha/beta fold hydrolase [Chitinimonas lacunae]|uniref:Alpha/beta fold hydrolase n=1 Tax=Chitinimonas lacunae TaxID=1963018 RepID=A0ABV8MQJ6_9NEIS
MRALLSRPGLGLALLLALSPLAQADPIAWRECRLPRTPSAAQCATLQLPAAEGGQTTLPIHIARLPALARHPKPDPVFLLAGGPGQAASDLGPVASVLERLRNERDIVLIDQRGTGRSRTLRCGQPAQKEDPLRAALKGVDDLAAVDECLRGLSGDPRLHTTADYLRDLEAVRERLGYAQINLWGGSYGTRVAQDYLGRHPERVRSLVLDGVAAPGLNLLTDLPVHAETALRRLYADCDRDAACRAAFPDGWRTFQTLSDQLGRAPVEVKVAHPASGEMVEGRLTRSVFHGVLRSLLYLPERAALIPQLVESTRRGDYAPLLAAGLSVQQGMDEDSLNPALFLAVACAEDWRPGLDGQAVHERAPLFGELFDHLDHACRRMPHGRPSAVRELKRGSQVPVLLLSGGLDPVTPPAQAEAVARLLPRSRHVVASGFGHIITPYRCVPRLVSDFIQRADPAALSQRCIDQLAATRRPPFYLSRLEARR